MPNVFTLDDFAKQFRILASTRLGKHGFTFLLDHFRPGRDEMIVRIDKILAATTQSERQDPSIIIGNIEHARIAAASGVSLADVEEFFAGFERLQTRMRVLAAMSFRQRLGEVLERSTPFGFFPWFMVAIMLLLAFKLLLK